MNVCEHVRKVGREQSPLGRILVSGYYDGATDGLVECSTCGQVYAFRKLAWDDGQNLRVFALAPVAQTLDHIREHLLMLPQSSTSATILPTLEGQEQEALERLLSTPSQYIIAAIDFRKGILAKRPLTGGEDEPSDWFRWLGVIDGMLPS